MIILPRKCHSRKCHSWKCHSWKCHSGKCQSWKCHSWKCHSRKCHSGKCQSYHNHKIQFYNTFIETMATCFKYETIKYSVYTDVHCTSYNVRGTYVRIILLTSLCGTAWLTSHISYYISAGKSLCKVHKCTLYTTYVIHCTLYIVYSVQCHTY